MAKFKENFVILGLIIAGLIIMVLQEKLGSDNLLYPYLTQLASALLIGGTISLLFKMFIDKDHDKRLAGMIKIHESVVECGLKIFVKDSKMHDYSTIISNSKELFIVLNDARRWVTSYSAELENRFSISGTLTEFYLTDPDGMFLKTLANKTNVTEIRLKDKIEQTHSLIIENYNRSNKEGIVKIYNLKNFPTLAIVCSEKFVITGLYTLASRRKIVPLFEYYKNSDEGGIYDFVYKDIMDLRKESKLIIELNTKNKDKSKKQKQRLSG